MITIITVNWNAYDFLWLMIESLERYSTVPYELIVIDNSEERLRVNEPHVYQFLMKTNIGHGRGLNHGVAKAYEMFPKNPYLMFLDIDCHILRNQWEAYFLSAMSKYDFIGGKGVPSKPVRPACMFMKKDLGRHDWCATEGFRGNRITPGGYDVGIKAYYKIMADGFNIGFLPTIKNRYGTINGEEFTLDNVPLIYHHWHGSSLHIRKDDFPDVDLNEDKARLFRSIPWRLP